MKEKTRKRRQKTAEFAKKLQVNIPNSEKWFHKLFQGYKIASDQFNVPLGGRFIPDVSNKEYKYIIEIDGNIHNLPHVKTQDTKKDKFFTKVLKYKVFRIQAYDQEQFDSVVGQIVKKYRPPHFTPAKITRFNNSITKPKAPKAMDISSNALIGSGGLNRRQAPSG